MQETQTPKITEDATYTPTNTPPPTPSPTPEIVETFIPAPELHLSSDAPNNQVPGDGNSQATIRVEVLNADATALSTLEVFFEVQGGGSINPARLPLNTVPLEVIYTAGETSSVKDIQIIALIDIPTVGRITGELTLQLIRQELSLEMPCGYVLNNDPSPQAISFEFVTNDSSGGSYRLRAILEDPPLGDLRNEITAVGSTQIQFVAQTGAITLYYTPPPQSEVGASNVCISVIDRPLTETQCVPIIWGVTTQLETRARPISAWHDQTWAVVWVDSLNSLNNEIPQPNSGFISYDVLLSNGSTETAHLLQNKTAWEPKQCHILNDLLITSSSNLSLEPMPYTGVLHFNITIPNSDGQAVTDEQIVLLGAERLILRNPNAILYSPTNSPDSSASFILDGTKPDAENFYLLSTQPFDPQQTETEVLVRFYARSEFLDRATNTILLPNDNSTLAITTSIESYMFYDRQSNVALNMTGETLPNLYIDPNPIIVNNEVWHPIYVFVQVATSDIIRNLME